MGKARVQGSHSQPAQAAATKKPKDRERLWQQPHHPQQKQQQHHWKKRKSVLTLAGGCGTFFVRKTSSEILYFRPGPPSPPVVHG
ncbi:hypothetical protein ZHAS_00019304 [Anopheles sinensis]|uniref:Uncharacterized protein n=1 Tax=Anopheles sinensis TaxID=74873 RepID=A0A084WM15_ANOSI|nr:hypothetical protein ZHAS_00019304 [Anopheles sinensis]